MQVIDLYEETDHALPHGTFSDAAALSLSESGHFVVSFPSPLNGYRYTLRSKGWVGHIPIGPDTLIRVRPKAPVSTIFGMLEVAYNLKSFQLLDGETDIDTVSELFERVAAILSYRILDRARKGLYQTYLSENEPLAFVRGRINMRESLRLSARGSVELYCEFQDLTHDLEDNQILLWTLYHVSRRGIERPEVRRTVQKAYRVLGAVVGLHRKEYHACIGRLYHRLNDDYRPLHSLCQKQHKQQEPDKTNGQNQFLPFKLNMPRLFEMFVAEWLRKSASAAWAVTAQHEAKLQGSSELVFRIDLVLKQKISGRPFAVLDTKFKLSETPSEAGVQQAVAYAVEMGVRHAFLVYPNALAHPVRARVGDIEVRSLSFDISSEINAAGTAFLERLTSSLSLG